MDVPEAFAMLAGLKAAVTPEGSEMVESNTEVLKLLNGVAVSVMVPDDPAAAESVEALGERVKSPGLPVWGWPPLKSLVRVPASEAMMGRLSTIRPSSRFSVSDALEKFSEP